jgi:hypothetical protein
MGLFPETGESQAMLLYHYIPSFPLAIVGLSVYAVFGIILTIQIYHSRSPKYLYILPFTALMEVVGYAVRLACHYYTNLGRYIGTTLFLLLAPNALALVNYKSVGEIIRLSGKSSRFFFLRQKFVTWFFFSSDILSFCLQGAGGGLQSTLNYRNEGIAVTLVGLALQLVFFASFAAITVYIHRNNGYAYEVPGRKNPKNSMIRCLYVTIFFLYIRSIYRVAEYASGYSGPIARLEWAFYVFDCLAIGLCFIAYILFFIGKDLPKRDVDESSTQYSPSITEKY